MMNLSDLEGGREQLPTKAVLLVRNLFKRLYNELDESVNYFVEKYIDLFSTVLFTYFDLHM